MKTKLEILEETIQYINENGRAIDSGKCQYLTSDGKMCAVGRCLKNPENKEFINKSINTKIYDNLKDEYKGHDLVFWEELQQLHDTSFYWNNLGLSERGNIIYSQLKKKYS